MTGRRRGRVSFADDDFAGSTTLSSLPDSVERATTSARLDELAFNPHNPREGYADESVHELAASLRETGQLQPVTVVGRQVFLAHHPDLQAALGGCRWVVLTGNRRLAAARLAGLETLAVAVADHLGGTDPRLTEATLIENLHREDLPPLLEARELKALVDRHGSQAAVAKRVSKTPGWVSQRLALLNLTPDLQDQLRAEEITLREARAVASTPAPEQQQRLLALRTGERSDPSPPRPTRDELPAPPNSRLGAGPTGGDAAVRRGSPAGDPIAAPPRPRGRPRKPADVPALARDLRSRLAPEEIEQLVDLLTADAST